MQAIVFVPGRRAFAANVHGLVPWGLDGGKGRELGSGRRLVIVVNRDPGPKRALLGRREAPDFAGLGSGEALMRWAVAGFNGHLGQATGSGFHGRGRHEGESTAWRYPPASSSGMPAGVHAGWCSVSRVTTHFERLAGYARSEQAGSG